MTWWDMCAWVGVAVMSAVGILLLSFLGLLFECVVDDIKDWRQRCYHESRNRKVCHRCMNVAQDE